MTKRLIIRFVMFLAFAGGQSVVMAQAPQAPSRSDLLKAFAAQKKKLDDVLEEMVAKHDEAVKQARAKAVKQLEGIAKNEMSQGEIAKATATWTEILKIDPINVDAKAYFRSIGRIDDALALSNEILRKQQTGSSAPSPTPIQRIVWRGEDGNVFQRSQNGSWIHIMPVDDGKGAKQYAYEEISRNAESVELFRKAGARGSHLMLYPDHSMWRWESDRDWTLVSDGHWVQ
ncbi:hypothetical protein GC197_04405 [bacterium]|nr:hypothetical protein [bacterium]